MDLKSKCLKPNTRDLQSRYNIYRIQEFILHLFFGCSFSIRCWNYLGIIWDTKLNFFNVLIKEKIDFQQPFFMENDRIAAWHIWILGSKEMEKWTGLSTTETQFQCQEKELQCANPSPNHAGQKKAIDDLSFLCK